MPERLRASVVCIDNHRLLTVRLQDPVSHTIYLFPPGGKVEEGESEVDAARRETLEETGYEVQVDEKSQTILKYPFVWAGTKFDCTTHFFKVRLLSRIPSPVRDVSYHLGIEWLALDKISDAFEYHSGIRTTIESLLG